MSEGNLQIFKILPKYVNNITPICLPKNKPNIIPNVTGSQRRFSFIPEKETPALAKAKIGKIMKLTQGSIECSSLDKGEWADVSLGFMGIN